MTSVTSRAQHYSQRKLRRKRWVFRRVRKTGSDCVDVTWCGRLFQTREAATGKARSPYVDRCSCSGLCKESGDVVSVHQISEVEVGYIDARCWLHMA